MTALAPPLALSPDPIRHASREEYAAFLRTYLGTPGSVRATLGVRDRFVRAYPDLALWLHAPLAERIGCVYDQGQRQIICPASHAARPYLYYLAGRGSLRFDWEWLNAVRWLPLRGRLGPRVDAALDQLAEEAVGLGYSRRSARDPLGFVVSRILLHTGDWDVEHIGEAEMEALQHAVWTFGERHECARFFGSAETYRHLTWHYISCLHALHVVLYHRGQIATEPRRLVHTPTRSVTLPARRDLPPGSRLPRSVSRRHPAAAPPRRQDPDRAGPARRRDRRGPTRPLHALRQADVGWLPL